MAENGMLEGLIQELESLVQLSTHHVDTCKLRISAAKDLLNFPSRLLAPINDSTFSNNVPSNVNLGSAEVNNSPQEDLLEEEVTRILQIAESVMDKATTRGNQKSRISSTVDSNVTGTYKGPAQRSHFNSACVKTEKKAQIKSDKKTIYQKDYSLVKSKSMPSLLNLSKEKETPKPSASKRNSYHHNEKMVSTQCKEVGCNNRYRSLGRNKDFIKINKQNLSLGKKEIPVNTSRSKRVPEASRLHQIPKVSEPFLTEELSSKTQLPKNREILMLLRDSHNFLTGSCRKAGKKEIALKENFIERCNFVVSHGGMEQGQSGILDALLPHCGWAFGRNEILTATDLCKIKDTILELEEKVCTIYHSNVSHIEKEVKETYPEVINVQNFSEIQESLSPRMSPFWHPLVMSSVLQGVNLPSFLYYNNTHEWISFQNTVHELHEYYIQLKILENILPLIAEVLASKDSGGNNAENSVGDWNKLLSKLLKTAAVLADFTGHLTVPILASLKTNNESAKESS